MTIRSFDFCAALVLAWGCSSLAQGAILAQYEFTGPSLAVTTVDPSVTAGNVTPAPMVGPDTPMDIIFLTGVGYPAADEPAIGARRVASTAGNDINNVYFSFTVSANAGLMDLTSLTFNVARGGGAVPRVYDLRSSVDAFATSITGSVAITTARPTFTPVSVDLSGEPFQDLPSITFRMHFFAPDPTQAVDFDAITLNGVIPEPTSLALVLLGLGGIGGVSRRGWLPLIRK